MRNNMPLEERVKEKLTEINSGYQVEDYCTGRLFLSALIHPKSETFSCEEKKEIGNFIRQRVYSDFATCASTASLLTGSLFGFGLPNLRDKSGGYKSFYSEFEHMEYLATSYEQLGISFEDLSEEAQSFIRKRRNMSLRRKKTNNKNVEVYFLSKNNLLDYSPQLCSEDLKEFEGFKIRPKLNIGQKFNMRLSKLLAPKKKDLEELLKSNKVDTQFLREQTISYITAILSSGDDFHVFKQDIDRNYKLIDTRYINLDPFLDKIGDLFLIDTGGATIYVKDQDTLKSINPVMEHLNRVNSINLINDRYEDNSTLKVRENPYSYPKDGAILYGIKGMLGSSFCEIRFNTLLRGIEGEIGVKAHQDYKRNEIRDFKTRVNHSDELKKYISETASMLDMTEGKLLS